MVSEEKYAGLHEAMIAPACDWLATSRSVSYLYRMNKQALSVTLSPGSIAWLRARMAATGSRSLSETLDRIIESARSTQGDIRKPRSVVGLVRLPEDDPDLETSGAAVRALFSTYADDKPARPLSAPQPRRPKGRRG